MFTGLAKLEHNLFEEDKPMVKLKFQVFFAEDEPVRNWRFVFLRFKLSPTFSKGDLIFFFYKYVFKLNLMNFK